MYNDIMKSENEKEILSSMDELFEKSPIFKEEKLENLGLFLTSKNLSRILYMNHIYQLILNIHGSVFDFGCRWGQNSVLFSNLRSIYEPFHRHRKIVSFDTFEGFSSLSNEDGDNQFMVDGFFKLPENYEKYLDKLMRAHELLNPISHIKKYEIIKGDACNTVKEYLSDHPETIIALAYFDFDIYKPTKDVLELIKDKVVKGSVIAFDELNEEYSKGETIALKEVFGLNNIKLQRLPITSRTSYFVVE